MTIPGCIRFLETGQWLNVYESVALKIGVSHGPEFDDALREKLGVWHGPRTTLDRLMGFRKDTHYAALNIGRMRTSDGKCCVRFGPATPLVFATCFAGDTLQVVFDENAVFVLSRDEILEQFSTYAHGVALSTVYHQRLLANATIIDKDMLVEMLDDRETLIEVHIHGSVRRGQPRNRFTLGVVFEPRQAMHQYENAPAHARRRNNSARFVN